MDFNQTFELHDLVSVAILVVLEAVLSIDNALVLGLLAKRLPKSQRAKALTLGLVGAFGFRFLSIATAQWLLTYTIVKLLGGLYLFYVSLKYFWDVLRRKQVAPVSVSDGGHAAGQQPLDGNTADSYPGDSPGGPSATAAPHVQAARLAPEIPMARFWPTVAVIELTDIAFAVDSIVAAIGLVGPAPSQGWHPKLWVVVTGGMMGVVLMRYAATVFIRLLELFPRFETAAYLLVSVIGAKLTLDWAFNTPDHPHSLDFHNPRSLAFWVFWLVMAASFCVGFIPKRQSHHHAADNC